MSIEDPHSLNEVVHGRTRLKVLATLSNVAAMDFVTLRDQLNISDGALSLAVKKLHEFDLVKLSKSHEMGRSKTTISISSKGQKELDVYITQLQSIIGIIPPKPGASKRSA
jgi:DNA-binding MarR family transcriptional regulator